MIKKKAKNNIFVILGLIIVSLVTVVSGAGYDWTQYGNGYQPLTQAQLTDATSVFNTTEINTQTVTDGQNQYTHPTQPLVDELNQEDTNYLVLTEGNYIKLYDKNLNYQTEVYTEETPLGQLGIVDWDQDGNSGEIAGFYRENATLLHFKTYEFNSTSNTLQEIYDVNLTWASTNGVTGVRCSGYECYGIVYDTNGTGYYWTSFRINNTGYVANQLYATRAENTYYPLEPPAKVDYNGNGINDYLIFSEDKVVVYDELGAVIRNWTANRGSNRDEYFRGAKFYKGDASPYWKVAFIYDVPYQASSTSECGTYACSRVQQVNIVDGSIISEYNVEQTQTSADNPRTQGIAVADYNGDGYDDIWALAERLTSNQRTTLKITKGDGTNLYTNSSLATGGALYPNSQITLAKLDSDSTYDMITYPSGDVWSPALNAYIESPTLTGITGQGACIPADLNYDGVLDIVCVDSDTTLLLTPNYTNQNSYITQIAYDPATLIQEGETINAFITANDTEGDSILYSGECDTGEGYSSETTSNVVSCTYSIAGTYYLTVRVRDAYHIGLWDSYTQEIIVTTTGSLCNNNGICESSQGETEYTCPADCGTPELQQTTGGTPIPTKLVDVDNVEQGILPEIYYGTLAFFSNTITPVIIIVFVIFFTLIILTIGTIIKKIGKKVTS